MLNMNMNAQVLADNTIAINGVAVGKLTDADAQKVWDIVTGMVNAYTGTAQVARPQSSGLTFADEQPAPTKVIRPAEDVTVTLNGKDNAVWFSATARDVRQVVNAQLKTAGFVYDKDAERTDKYVKDYTDAQGVTHKAGEHKHGAWVALKGNKRDLVTGKAWIGRDITVTAAERQAVRDGWEARKAKRG